ncbi:MAG: hypothetical protein D8M58_19025 [Calditrichaeota bacterium]|nr:MAG: hypothetical protein DWQ03_21705 [Calditrichota bacterium]MBL1207504.1 hypothetical protein [Calditrichota bacterium]NOG47336.1 hypothetical protein [Calditrichota bacterium]
MFAEVNYLVNVWWQWMAAMLWQATLFIIIISTIDILIRRWVWPQVRYGLWLLVLVKLMVSPTWSSSSSIISNINPQSYERIVFAGANSEKHIENRNKSHNFNSTIGSKTHKSDQNIDPQTVEYLEAGVNQSWKTYAFVIWIAGMLVFFSLLILKMVKLRKWHRRYKENETIPAWFNELLVDTSKRIGLMNLPAIVFSDKAVTPAVYGLLRPVLLLPANYLNSLPKKDVEHILIHELSHLKRGDLWLHGLCLVMQIIYWFNPLMIWVRREMKHVREICCDLTVASVLGEKTNQYRQTLLNTARKLLTETVEPGLGLLGVFEEPFRLVSRLKWLEKKKWLSRKWIVLNSALASLFIVIAIMPMAAMEKSSDISLNQDNFNTPIADGRTVQYKDSVENGSVIDKIINLFKPEPKPVFKVQQSDPFWAIILPVTGTTDQMPAVFEKLRNYMDANMIKKFGNPFIRKYDDESIVGILNVRWEAAFRIKDSVAVKKPFQVIRIPRRDVLSARVGKNFDQKNWSIQATSWLYHNNYRSLPPHHIYWPNGVHQPGKQRPAFNFEIEIRKFEEPIPKVDIYTRHMRGRHELILQMKGSHDQENGALLKIQRYVKKRNIKTLSAPFVRYFNTPEWTADEDLTWHVGIAIKKDLKIEEPFRVEWKDGCKLACTIFEGNHSEIPLNFWHGFALTLSMNGYKVKGVPVKLLSQKLEGNNYSVELQWPVNKW